ncbi:MAG: acetolactate synthase [Oscillospiraceae bacterium]|nr:acetolactate synthase [Oscillospiraceae bacterium]
MSIKQISVFLENKPGKLEEMTALLAEKGIDMRAISLAETKDFGIARLIADDVLSAVNVLRDGDFIAKLTPVLAYAVPNEPGGLHKLLTFFRQEDVNIEYMYSSLGGSASARAYMIFRVADTERAEAALTSRGLVPLTQEEISLA